jgi:hypothetical protein
MDSAIEQLSIEVKDLQTDSTPKVRYDIWCLRTDILCTSFLDSIRDNFLKAQNKYLTSSSN